MKLNDKGMGLVEVLVATVILSIVGLGAFQFLGQANKTYTKVDDSKVDKLLQLRLMRVLENESYCKEILNASSPNFTSLAYGELALPTTIIKNKFSSIYNIGISFSNETTTKFNKLIEKSTLKDKNFSIEHDISRSFTFSKIKLLKESQLSSLITSTPNGEMLSITIPTLFEVAKFDGNNFTQKHYTSRVDRPIPLTLVFKKNGSTIQLEKCYSRGSRAIVAGTQICNSLGGAYSDTEGCKFFKFKGSSTTLNKNIRYQNTSTTKLDFQKYLCNLDQKVVKFEKQTEDAIVGPKIDPLKTMSSWKQLVINMTPLPALFDALGGSNATIIPRREGNPNAKTSYCAIN